MWHQETNQQKLFHNQSLEDREGFRSQLKPLIELRFTLCKLGNFSCFCCRLLFSKSTFSKNIFQEHYSECQTVWIQIRTEVLLVMIWVQTVCKGYEQMIKVIANNEELKYNMLLNKLTSLSKWSMKYEIWIHLVKTICIPCILDGICFTQKTVWNLFAISKKTNKKTGLANIPSSLGKLHKSAQF